MKRLAFVLLLVPALVQAQKPTVIISGDGSATVVSVGTQGPAGANIPAAGSEGQGLCKSGAGLGWCQTFVCTGGACSFTVPIVAPNIWVSVTSYGATGNGVTDDSAAVIAAIAAVSATGGTIFFPTGRYLIAGKLSIPNDGQHHVAPPGDPNNWGPAQKPLRLTGQSQSYTNNYETAPTGASVLLMTATDTVAKVDTRGYGYMEIDHLSFVDTVEGSTPFIQTTNTALHIHDCAFWGKNAADAAVQDAIILGGVGGNGPGGITIADDTENGGFQGYGTVIEDNHFEQIRRAVFGRAWVNSVYISRNVIWNESGYTTGAAIELAGVASLPDMGNTISDNLIEVLHYKYGIQLSNASWNTISGNSFWDGFTVFTAGVRFELTATRNIVMGGYYYSNDYIVSDADGSQLNNNIVMVPGAIGALRIVTAYNQTGLRVESTGNTTPGVRLIAGATNAGVRNWGESISFDAFGDFVIRQSDAKGGDPLSAGTTRLALSANGLIPPTLAFASLGTPANGNFVYCSDCTIANPCGAGGTGALAKRLNGAWVCN